MICCINTYVITPNDEIHEILVKCLVYYLDNEIVNSHLFKDLIYDGTKVFKLLIDILIYIKTDYNVLIKFMNKLLKIDIFNTKSTIIKVYS